VTAVTAVPRPNTATACRSLGGHGPAVTVHRTAVTAVIVGVRIARAVMIVPAVTAVTRRAFVTRPRDRATMGAVTTVTGQAFVTGGGIGDRGRRDRRDRGSSVLVGIAVAAVTAMITELRPTRDVHLVGGVQAFAVAVFIQIV
jgi:hypothetical protein